MKSKLNHLPDVINRIVVRGVNWVGDSILTYPTVQTLKDFFPQSHLAIMVPSHLVDLWKTLPYIDEIIPFNRRRDYSFLREDFNLLLFLKRRNFDLAVILPRSFRSALQIYLARIPIRIGYSSEGRSHLLTHPRPRNLEVLHMHRVHYYKKLIEPLGKEGGLPSPRIFLREEDRGWAKATLRGLGLNDGSPLIGINPGATYGLAKCWDPNRFGELGKRIFQRQKTPVLLFGKEEEKPIVKEILRHVEEGGVDFTGKTSLLQLAALLEKCQLLVTNDTGTMHVATAVGTPVVAIFGSTNPVTTGPWGNGHVVLKKNVPCSPCLKRVCPIDHRCMSSITVDEVEGVVVDKLRDRER